MINYLPSQHSRSHLQFPIIKPLIDLITNEQNSMPEVSKTHLVLLTTRFIIDFNTNYANQILAINSKRN